jgi:parvulin-like peptidyl-prolyl isomerase
METIMGAIAVKGTYRNGIIELAEPIDAADGQSVMVMVQEETAGSQENSAWASIEQEILARNESLTEMSEDDITARFEQLSQKIADNFPYETYEELERAMRDPYGLTRY